MGKIKANSCSDLKQNLMAEFKRLKKTQPLGRLLCTDISYLHLSWFSAKMFVLRNKNVFLKHQGKVKPYNAIIFNRPVCFLELPRVVYFCNTETWFFPYFIMARTFRQGTLKGELPCLGVTESNQYTQNFQMKIIDYIGREALSSGAKVPSTCLVEEGISLLRVFRC